MKLLINKCLKFFNLRLVRNSNYEIFLRHSDIVRDFGLAKLIDPQLLEKYFENLKFSKSQLRQDLFVLGELGFKKGGFFVEFGATDGIALSNSFLLETRFGWNGILAEPAKKFHRDLANNRSVNIETDCVWKATGEKLIFNEVQNSELSTIASFSNSDHHAKPRNDGERYEVNTISLDDLLEKFDAPKFIDYLSIDTEGSEFEILNSFNFNKYKFKVITVEHNFNSNRNHLYDLLINNGYKRKFVECSSWDDWYVLCK